MTGGDLILMGPPGSGKGTQAKLLAATPGWVHLSTGDLFRENIAKSTPLGTLAEGYLSKGAYVPDDVTVGMVRERLRTVAPADRVAFDGFPRTVPQAAALDALLVEAGRRITHVVLIDCPREELTRRLVKRGEGRTDDTPEVIGKRFDAYQEQTRPVVQRYEREGLVRRVNGVGGPTEIAARLRAALA